jgi:transcription elongation factor Elf1
MNTVQAICPNCRREQKRKTAILDEYFQCFYCNAYTLKKDWKVIVPETKLVGYGEI